MTRVLVTGATGYLGSHACVALLEAGHEVIGVDDLSNSSPIVLDRIAELARPLDAFHQLDIRSTDDLADVFRPSSVEVVFHFAGLKSVAESIAAPLSYYDVNVGGTLALIQAMQGHGVKRLIFSSSCTVYGEGGCVDEIVSVDEDAATAPLNPYGRSKLMAEQILADVANAHGWTVCSLRYFNPVGAHPSGRLGESPTGELRSLVPLASAVAAGDRSQLSIFGVDYPTIDGTCIRDYVHVTDVIDGHLAALDHLDEFGPFTAVNLGTGQGYTVHQVIDCVRRVSGRPVPTSEAPRRPGDASGLYADPTRAGQLLGWKALRSLDDMVTDHWRWLSANPEGYR